MNAAQRFAFVGVLSAQRCVQPRLMQRLVESYLVNGEYRAAEKYIRILEASPRYRDWAKEQRALLDPAKAVQADWLVAKRKQLPLTDNPFDLTVTYPSAIAYLVDDHPDNQAAFEYADVFLGCPILAIHQVALHLPALFHFCHITSRNSYRPLS